jgi:putative hydrolase of the HAD superfamily
VKPALERLARRYRLIAVSNGNAEVARIGLGEYFAGSVSARLHGVAKPDPSIFHAACAVARAAPHQVLHLGDDLALDVDGALPRAFTRAGSAAPTGLMPMPRRASGASIRGPAGDCARASGSECPAL